MAEKTKHITEGEWGYLTPKARELVIHLKKEKGIQDTDLDVELAVLILGDEVAYDLE
jgi:hypothetical protein